MARSRCARLAPPRPVNPEAHEAYLRGTYWVDKGSVPKGVNYLQEAIKKDPTYAPAYTALSFAYDARRW